MAEELFGGNGPGHSPGNQQKEWLKWGGIGVAVLIVIIGAMSLFRHKGGPDDEALDRKEVQAVKASMRRELEQPGWASKYLTDEPRQSIILKSLNTFYESRRFRPIWLADTGVTAAADTALAILRRSYGDGLEPENYKATLMTKWRDSLQGWGLLKARPQHLAEFELALSGNLLQYAAHMATGRINPGRLDTNWKFEPKPIDLAAFLEKAHQGGLLEQVAQLEPGTRQYASLRKSIARYRGLNSLGGWPTNLIRVDSGTRGAAVLALKKRLALDNYLDTNSAEGESPLFGMETAQAIRAFQQSVGHEVTGRLDTKTLTMLNHPVSWWVRHMELNLERMRWIGPPPEGTFILVNVPDYSLKVLRDGKDAMDMCVVVGDEYHSTPVFSGTIQTIIFNPDWTIPARIAAKEVLPILKRNPDFLTRDSIDVYESWEPNAPIADISKIDWDKIEEPDFHYKLVQKPGKRNPLGRMKFIFPNDASVYLHDTPFRGGFKKRMRDMSHGCVRLEHPEKLASLLLEDEPAGGQQYMQDIFKMNLPTPVELEKPVPVQIAYITVWADENGRVQYRDDIYGHDADHIKAIYEKEKNLMVRAGPVPYGHARRGAAVPKGRT